MRTQPLLGAGALALAISGATAAQGFAQDVTLRYHWTKGEQSRSRLTQQTSTAISPAGQAGGASTGSFESSMTQVFRTVVEDVGADGSATLELVIESIRADLRTPFGTTVFDSDAAGADASSGPMAQAIAAAYGAMIGQPVRMVVSPTGAIRKIEGFSRLLEGVLNAQPTDRVEPELLDGFRNAFRDDTAGDMLGWGVAPFPDHPLHSGDTWQDRLTATIPIVGATTTLREWTLRGLESANGSSTARVAGKTTIAPDPSAPQPAVGPVPLRLGVSSVESEILFDVSLGRLQRATMTLVMPATLSLPAGSERKNVEMRITGTVTLEVIEAAGR